MVMANAALKDAEKWHLMQDVYGHPGKRLVPAAGQGAQ
jgi:hypothetical protein